MRSVSIVQLLCIVGAMSAPQHGRLVGVLPRSNTTHGQHFGIVGGQKTSISKYPYLSSLQIKGVERGAAVILNENWLLTIGFVTFRVDLSDFTFRVGSSFYDKQGQVLKASKVIPHPKYTAQNFDYDIAVIKVAEPIKFNKNVKAIGGLGSKRLKVGTKGWTAGWGDSSANSASENVLEAQVTVSSQKECSKTYSSTTKLTSRSFCTLDKTVAGCESDFGDPVVVDNVLYGLLAGGRLCQPGKYPLIYTDVAALSKWVQHTIKNA